MGKTKMPKTRDEFERIILVAFQVGMWRGYGINHENLVEEEADAMREFALDWGLKRTNLN